MLFLAAATTTADKLKEIPPDFWWKLALAIVGLIAVVIFLRKVAKMNKVVLTMICLIAFSVFGFNWIYERNEPKWATPVVDWLAGFFPSKGKPAAPPAGTPAKPATAPAKRS